MRVVVHQSDTVLRPIDRYNFFLAAAPLHVPVLIGTRPPTVTLLAVAHLGLPRPQTLHAVADWEHASVRRHLRQGELGLEGQPTFV